MVIAERRAVEATGCAADSNRSPARRLCDAWLALGGIPDPEVPAVSIVELGIVRDAVLRDDRIAVVVTPTYSGCPATEAINAGIAAALAALAERDPIIETRLAPAWTTDWIAPEARVKLRRFGIAPPQGAAVRVDITAISSLRRRREAIACPRCGSTRTRLVAQFGSTACKAHFRCEACLEPFDYFKTH